MKRTGLKFTSRKKQGYKKIVSPKNTPLRSIEFGTVNLRKGESITLPASKREIILTLLGGRCSIECGDLKALVGPRKNIFREFPWAVYARGIKDVQLTAGSQLEMLLSAAPASSRNPVIKLIKPSVVVERIVGSGTYKRRVRTIVGEDFPAERLLVGETLNEAGKWSSYPPHRHEKNDPPREVKLEEVYYYKLEDPKAFGLQRIYTDDGRIDEAHTIRQDDLCVLPRGYHPVAATPNSRLYYFWALAGKKRKMHVRVDPNFE
jgi:5-deoxy-glucuronate isomerase